jgi:SCY1-like protein 2
LQCSALNAIVCVLEQLDSETVRKTVIPKSKAMFENNCPVSVSVALWNLQTPSSDRLTVAMFFRSKVQSNALLCIEKVIDTLEKGEILDDVLPMLLNAKVSEPIILMPVISKHRLLSSDRMHY